MRKVLISCAVLAAACTGQEGAEAPVAPPTTEPGQDLIVVGADEVAEMTTTTEVEATTTTTTEAPTTTTTAAPLPVLCPRLPHPAHHDACPPEPAEYLQPEATTAVVERSTTWAIPTYIVMCESGGRWDAHNPSGASGPYQLMPMHFGGELAMNQSRAAQHAKAAELWDGGKGKSHWSECL